MTFKQFQQDALRTESRIEKATVNPALFGQALNLAIMATELMDVLKKNIFYGKPIDRRRVAETLMDAQETVGVLLYGESAGNEENTVDLPENIDTRILHGIIGKFTESGELLQALAKGLNGDNLDLVNIGEELGDDQWYNAILADAAGLDMDAVQGTVIAKLKARYPDKFTSEAAIERDLTTERAVLEEGLKTGTGDQ